MPAIALGGRNMKTNDKTTRIILASLTMLVLVLGSLWLFGRSHSPDTGYVQALRMTRLAHQMSEALHAAAQAEKQAVMAETDEASKDFANQAQNATSRVGELLREFKAMPKLTSEESALIGRVETSFAEYRKVDEEVLGLAVQNTNLKALSLSFGTATSALSEMEQALTPLIAGPDAEQARQAQRALAEALRIQSLHGPHILEKTDARMDALDKDMAAADKAVRAALGRLGRNKAASVALASYERYWALTVEIQELSRQNTNVRSLALSLDRKVKVLATCDEALQALALSLGKSAAKATK